MHTTMPKPTVLITGASSGIGAATARLLTTVGHRVVLVARSQDKLTALCRELGPLASAIPMDLTIPAEVVALGDRAEAAAGNIGVVFANAGSFIAGDLVDGDPEHWAAGIDLNITALCRTLRATVPHLVARKSGHVIITSSVAGRRWIQGQTIYCATKAAVSAIAEGLRREMIPHGIRVSLISPGWVSSEFWDGTISTQALEQARADQQAITSEDIANAVRYAIEQPPQVTISEIMIHPLRQAH